VIVWDLVTGEEIRRYTEHAAEIAGLCFSPQERTVFSASADRTVRQWRIDATQDDLLAWIQANRYVPELTPQQRAKYQLDLFDTA
jgi:WD40 repeat protein